ncbi:MAG: hypothetical protein ACOVPA_09520 [Rubrivivax sp.]
MLTPPKTEATPASPALTVLYDGACPLCLPGAGWLMERTYRLFLHARPTLQRWASRLD